MQIPVMKQVIDSYIDVEFPHYYTCDISGDDDDCRYYGRLLENGDTVCITRTKSYLTNGVRFEITHEINSIDSMMSYFKSECKSSKFEFDCVAKEMIEFINERTD